MALELDVSYQENVVWLGKKTPAGKLREGIYQKRKFAEKETRHLNDLNE